MENDSGTSHPCARQKREVRKVTKQMNSVAVSSVPPRLSSPNKKIWIDLENSPHVPFFRPIIDELRNRGYLVTITARDCFQVIELAELAGLKYKKVGHHYGKHKLAKMAGLCIRVAQMLPLILREKPDLAVSHGSRSCFVLANLLHIPTITIMDYEHAKWVRHPKSAWVMAPEIIPDHAMQPTLLESGHVLRYPGIKEDVYTPSFSPDPNIKSVLGFSDEDIVVTVRPPANEAHYHNPESDQMLALVLHKLASDPRVKAVLVPRTTKQGEQLRAIYFDAFAAKRFVIPEHVVDGLDLIWYSDLVISGGGTMNREAAALGVPVYSIFRGTVGAVDKYLSDVGRLVLLQDAADVESKLEIVRREQRNQRGAHSRAPLETVVSNITAVLES
jgi:predicted glycosyltransferase